MGNILVLPDIHGRRFWKKAIEENIDKVSKIVFLGDMLDPYPWECATEGITRKTTIENFQEIIDFKLENKDKVILLLGNHDLCYVDRHNFSRPTRYDSSNAWHIEEMFRSHRSLFQLAYEETINGKKYLFTHAGLLKGWYDNHEKLIGELTVENLNFLLNSPKGLRKLNEASRTRGAWCNKYGSIVWNDIEDIPENVNDELPWDYQVFGHCQQEKHPIITKDWACLDCRKAFILTDEGGFQEC